MLPRAFGSPLFKNSGSAPGTLQSNLRNIRKFAKMHEQISVTGDEYNGNIEQGVNSKYEM